MIQKVIDIDLDRDRAIKDLYYYSRQVEFLGEVRSNESGWQSGIGINCMQHMTWLSGLVDDILREGLIFMESLKPKFPTDSVTLRMWANINSTNDMNKKHEHMPDMSGADFPVLSGVYYLSKPENSGELFFETQDSLYKRLYKHPLDEIVNVKEGQAVFFLPCVKHSVQTNLSEDDRISIAFNFTIDQ